MGNAKPGAVTGVFRRIGRTGSELLLSPEIRAAPAIPHETSMSDLVHARITFYGYPDNDDGQGHFGTSVIALALTWQGRPRNVDATGVPFAGGAGTFDDPITAAASAGNPIFPAGTLVYIPGLRKYFLVEDECASCTDAAWLDLWMESNIASDPDLVESCEWAWTGDPMREREILLHPPPDLDVDPTPFVDPVSGRCSTAFWW